MSEEYVVDAEQVEEPAEAEAEPQTAEAEPQTAEAEPRPTVTEEIKVQAEDLFQAINDVVREGSVKRITVMRNDRVLIDLPLVVGVAASTLLALWHPVITAVVGIVALLGGCTVRIEREEPPEGEPPAEA